MQATKIQSQDRSNASGERAFTFTDLLVVVVALGLLLFVLIPAQADSRTKTRGVRCLDNLRQITAAILMYTRDNHDFFPPNPDDGNTNPGHNWCPGQAGVGGPAEFNSDLLADLQRCLIARYLNTNASLFRCTADLRVGPYQGSDPAKLGKRVPAARSVSMNLAVGTICPFFDAGGGHSGKPVYSVNGSWFDGAHSHRRNSPYRTYGRLSDVILPGPAGLFLVAEEDPTSINDGGFSFSMAPEWIDFPSLQHGMSGVVSFADGHVELHHWVDQTTRVPVPIGRRAAGGTDWAWLRDRTSARAQ